MTLALTLPGCGRDRVTDTKEPQDGVILSISVARGEFNPPAVIVTVEARNVGAANIIRGDGCSFWMHGIELEFVAPDGRVWYPSNRSWGRCPDFEADFPPGQRLIGTAQFDGLLYGAGGVPTEEATTGHYIAVARFRWSLERGRGEHELEHRLTFEWGRD